MKFRYLLLLSLMTGGLLFPPITMSDQRAAADYYENALVRFKNDDLAGAKIQLKNALQQNANLLAARVLLGRIHLKEGNGASAEKELMLANKLGVDHKLTIVLLAEAYLVQFKYQNIIDDIPTDGFPTQIRNKLLDHRGHAFIELGKYDKAAQVFTKLRQFEPESAIPKIGRATIMLRRGNAAEALKLAHQAVEIDTSSTTAWNIKASSHHTLGQLNQALKDYEQVIKLDPKHVDARIARVGIWLDQKQIKQADDELLKLRAEAKLEPRAAYLHSVVLGQTGDTKGSRKALEEAAGIIGRIKPEFINRRYDLLMLAGVTYYGLNQFEKARSYLERYINRYPNQVGARKLLGSLLLASNENDAALSVLKPAYKLAPNDFRVLSLLGTAYMRKGAHKKATHLFEQAIELSSGSPDVRTELAMSHIGSGDQLSALAELNDVFTGDPKQTRAGVLLGMLHIKRGDYGKAVTIAKQLHQQQPDNLTILNLLGNARVLAGDRVGARTVFQQTLSLDPKFTYASIALARIDALDGHSDKAIKDLEKLLNNDTKNSRILIELAQIEDRRNNHSNAIRWLEKARSSDRNELPARLYLANLYIRTNRPDKAIKVIQEAEIISPNNLSVLELSGLSYEAAGKHDTAKVIFKRMNNIANFDADWLYRIARHQIRVQTLSDAIYSLFKAVQSKPDFFVAQVALVETQLQAGRIDNASVHAADLVKKHPDNSSAHRLLGDIALQRKRYADAIKHYQTAIKIKENSSLFIRLYRAHILAGDTTLAINILEQRLASDPKDAAILEALAEGYLNIKDYSKAQKKYEQLVKKFPNRYRLLNNLAYVYAKLNNSNALTYARRAHQIAPNDAVVNDTLGWMLVQQDQVDEGLPYLRNAHFRMSANPEIRYHIAVALHKLGRNQEARAELDKVLTSTQPFEGLENAKALHQQLSTH